MGKKKSVELSLSLIDRAVLKQFLPATGDFLQQSICNELRKKILISDEEVLKYTTPAGGLNKDGDKAPELKIDLAKPEILILEDVFRKNDKEKTITPDSFATMVKLKALIDREVVEEAPLEKGSAEIEK